MTYIVPDNHKGNPVLNTVFSELDTVLPRLFTLNGFTTQRYPASVVATASQGPRTAEFKIHFPTKSESILAIDHTVIRKTLSGRNVRSTRLLVCLKDVETTLSPLLAEPWTVVKRDLTLGVPNAPSKA